MAPRHHPMRPMDLPSRWPMICATAWEGVVASGYGLFCDLVLRHRDEDGKIYWTGGYEYTIYSVEWLKCAQVGCLWCRFLAKEFLMDLKRFSPQWPAETVHIRVGTYLECEWDKEAIIIIVNRLQRYFRLHTTEGNPAARWICHRILIPHVGWPYALALAKTCIEECVRDHPDCQAITPYPIGSAPLPTRLIDCSAPDCLRLIETNPGMRGTYVALSYVWGEEQPHRTTEANLSSYKIGIDPAILPQTILDAIHVTRALSIELLWIDGLCIIQDSEKDMHHELARMRDVYRHAFLTIDAGSASRVSQGFLRDRELKPKPNAVLPFICPLGHPSEPPTGWARVGVVYVTGDSTMYRTWPDDQSVGEYPGICTAYTVKRGWCLQERLLSTRSLVFTAQTLQLRCYTQTQNIGGAYHDGVYDVPRLPNALFLPGRHAAHGSDEWKEIHGRWLDIVHDYTGRKLSNPSDKLVAISALAEMFAPALRTDYVAGLWRHTLLTDLCWQSRIVQRRLRQAADRGPSWSWASTDSRVSWEYGSKCGCPIAEVLKCTVTLHNQNLPFGSVTDASLILRSCLLPCKCIPKKPGLGSDLAVEFPPFVSPLFTPKKWSYFSDDVDVSFMEEMWFVPLLYFVDSNSLNLRGLVSPGDVYQRVGTVTSDSYIVTKQESMDSFTDPIMYCHWILTQLPRVAIELV
ncbi:hypothetical protein ONZ51_g2147 [Trametes cubensis]|uniref:Heterokaryon incompatibility domain-containing protein n=1 Tax=Trametes cubensis TaxID=1111947 RepID=A0AAD7XF31_9APHY|nr:hypothetical protein ONZ51_g2147 [Trametes cubensis]